MEMHIAQTSFINYIGSAMWIAASVVIALLILVTIHRKFRSGIIIAGLLLALSSIPVAYMAELSLNGCCGSASSEYEGMGFLIGALLAILGVGLIIFGKRTIKQKLVI